MPSSNPDGRALNQRGNSTGQDLNRDHALIEQAETKAQAQLMRDYTPDVSVDNHEGDSEDLPILTARHLNVYEPLFNEGKSLVNEWMYGAASQSGWWMGPYSTGGDSHEGILRNTSALKNSVGLLGEARAAPGTTRPAEGGTNTRPNENRKAYAHLWENWEGFRYFYAKLDSIVALNKASATFQTGQLLNRTVLRGSYPWPSVPPVGVGTNAPDVDTPLAERILDPAPVRLLHDAGRLRRAADQHQPDADPVRLDRVAPGDPRHHRSSRGAGRARAAQAAAGRPRRPDAGRRGRAAAARARRSATTATAKAERSAARCRRRCRLTLGAPATLGAFTPGVAKEYVGATDATVVSTAGDATLTVVDAGANPGHLVNGAFSLPQPLQAQGGTSAFAAISASPLTLKTYAAPVSNDVVPIGFKQAIGANDALRTGTYSKTLTFTLSTTNP